MNAFQPNQMRLGLAIGQAEMEARIEKENLMCQDHTRRNRRSRNPKGFVCLALTLALASVAGCPTVEDAPQLLAPPPPQITDGRVIADGGVLLMWEMEEFAPLDGFSIYRADADGGPFQLMKEVGADERTFIDESAGGGGSLFYAVTARNEMGESELPQFGFRVDLLESGRLDPNNPGTEPNNAAPDPNTGLEPNNQNPVDPNAGAEPNVVPEPNTTPEPNDALDPNESEPNESAPVQIPAPPTITDHTVSATGTVTLRWQADSDQPITRFRIHRRPSGGIFQQRGSVSAEVRSFDDSSTQVGRTYEYAVTAENAAGRSPLPESGYEVTIDGDPEINLATPTIRTLSNVTLNAVTIIINNYNWQGATGGQFRVEYRASSESNWRSDEPLFIRALDGEDRITIEHCADDESGRFYYRVRAEASNADPSNFSNGSDTTVVQCTVPAEGAIRVINDTSLTIRALRIDGDLVFDGTADRLSPDQSSVFDDLPAGQHDYVAELSVSRTSNTTLFRATGSVTIAANQTADLRVRFTTAQALSDNRPQGRTYRRQGFAFPWDDERFTFYANGRWELRIGDSSALQDSGSISAQGWPDNDLTIGFTMSGVQPAVGDTRNRTCQFNIQSDEFMWTNSGGGIVRFVAED